jgi:hypothetical protein
LCQRLEKGEKYASGVNINTSKARTEGYLLCGGGAEQILELKYYHSDKNLRNTFNFGIWFNK